MGRDNLNKSLEAVKVGVVIEVDDVGSFFWLI